MKRPGKCIAKGKRHPVLLRGGPYDGKMVGMGTALLPSTLEIRVGKWCGRYAATVAGNVAEWTPSEEKADERQAHAVRV